MADPASLAQTAGELAGNARTLAQNLDTLVQQIGALPPPVAHGGTPFVFELTVFALAVFVGYYAAWLELCEDHGVRRGDPSRGQYFRRLHRHPAHAANVSAQEITERITVGESYSAFLYLIASICFIMALRGLSSPETARHGNLFGIAGMVIAALTTLASPHVVSYWLIIAGLLIGGAIGTYIARQIQMTALPQLVAAFHSLVGLAAVCVAAAAFAAPEDYGIGARGNIHVESLVEMAIGLTIGAITFTGSIVAFAKLQGLVSGAPLTFKGQHLINAALA